MFSLKVAQSDADLERWRQVRIAVAPGERSATVAEMRAMENPGRVLLVAEQDGQLLGSGVADHSGLGGGYVCPRVLPQSRRRLAVDVKRRELVQNDEVLVEDLLLPLAQERLW